MHADDASALIEALNLDPLVVASSGGARIAVELLRRWPDLVRGAVLSEPPMLHLVPEAAQPFVAELQPRIQKAATEHGPEAAVDAFFTFVCPGLWTTLDETAKTGTGPTHRRCSPTSTPPRIDSTSKPSPSCAPPFCSCAEPTATPSSGRLRPSSPRLLPDVRFIELTDSGHVTYAEQPEAFATAVTAFARELFAPATPSQT